MRHQILLFSTIQNETRICLGEVEKCQKITWLKNKIAKKWRQKRTKISENFLELKCLTFRYTNINR